jgi:hypothetical protein
MKLSPEKIELLAGAIVDELAEVDGVLFQGSDSDLRLAVSDIITDELMIEERLDAEIHKMLQAYKYEITMGRLNYDELYRKMRSRLLAERKIIL